MPLWRHAYRCPVFLLSQSHPITSQPKSTSNTTSVLTSRGEGGVSNYLILEHIFFQQNINLYLFPISREKKNQQIYNYLHLSETDTERGMRSNIPRTWCAILNAWLSKLFEMPRREWAPLLWCFVSVFLRLCTDERKIKNAFPSLSVNQSIHQWRTSAVLKQRKGCPKCPKSIHAFWCR